MIGNDIVDIAEAKVHSNWQRPRFLDKLFTLKEQAIIHNSEDSFLMVWQLWSMKEAAYKLYTQIYPSRFYNPKGFQCKIENAKGSVKFQGFKCYVNSKITSNYILSEARLNRTKMTSEVVIFNDKNVKSQSAYLKLKVLTLASKTHDVSKNGLQFNTSEFGMPTLNYNSKSINVSLTHHGNYGAIAIA